MQQLNLFKKQKRIIYVFLALATCLLLGSLYATLVRGADILLLALAILLVATNAYNLYSFKRFYFRYEAGRIIWRFPRMKTENMMEIPVVKKVESESFGVSFKNEKNERVKFSTEGLKKKDRQLVLEFFKKQ